MRQRDQASLAAVASGDPVRLVQAANAGHGMCGFWPTLVLMRAAQIRGLSEVTMLQYAVSIEAVPNVGATGFASFSFRRPPPSPSSPRL